MDNSPDFSKRYWVFLWWEYEPRGGLYDFHDSFGSIEESEAYGNVLIDFEKYDRGEIFDVESREIVSCFEEGSKWKRVDE
jgi:hypothetical protein